MEFKENGFTQVCSIDELKNKIGQRFMVDDVDIALFKVDGNVYAVSNICPHQHASIIYDGMVNDCKVICPAHGWEFNLTDGKMFGGRNGLTSYETKVSDNYVYVKVFKKELNW